MSGAAGVRALEESTNRAWPPLTTVRGPGWQIRSGEGLHSRRNSASIWPEASIPIESIIAQTAAHYANRGAPPIIKLTDASKPGLDSGLAASGWERAAPTIVMEATLEAGVADPGVTFADRPGHGWIGAFTRIAGYGEPDRRRLERLLRSIALPSAYASIGTDAHAAAVGMAVVDGAAAGIFEVATDERFRGRGFARRIVHALMHRCTAAGADTAYLQVVETNAGAIRMYQDLGFVEQYRYWYRIAPGN